MSETGATDEQIEAAARRAWEATGSSFPFDEIEPGGWFRDGDLLVKSREWAQHLVPPVFKIVPSDAVCVSPEIAETIREAVHNAIIDAGEQAAEERQNGCIDEAKEWEIAAESYRAAVTALRGEG